MFRARVVGIADTDEAGSDLLGAKFDPPPMFEPASGLAPHQPVPMPAVQSGARRQRTPIFLEGSVGATG